MLSSLVFVNLRQINNNSYFWKTRRKVFGNHFRSKREYFWRHKIRRDRFFEIFPKKKITKNGCNFLGWWECNFFVLVCNLKGMNGFSLECSINGNRSNYDLFRNIFKELNCAEFSWSVKQVRLRLKALVGKKNWKFCSKMSKISETSINPFQFRHFWNLRFDPLLYDSNFILLHFENFGSKLNQKLPKSGSNTNFLF